MTTDTPPQEQEGLAASPEATGDRSPDEMLKTMEAELLIEPAIYDKDRIIRILYELFRLVKAREW